MTTKKQGNSRTKRALEFRGIGGLLGGLGGFLEKLGELAEKGEELRKSGVLDSEDENSRAFTDSRSSSAGETRA